MRSARPGKNVNESVDSPSLGKAEERFRLVVESSPAAIIIVDVAGRIVLVNRQTENWFGFSRDELLGQHVEVLIPERFRNRHVLDRQNYLASPQSRPMGAGHELFGRRQNGSEFPVDISLHPMDTEDGLLVMAHVVDLTDRRRAAEEARLRASMERLALLGQLAGGVAHEIRNPLGVIRNAAYYLQMIQDSLCLDARESIAEIQQEVDKANHIVGDLLDYARESPVQKVLFDLGRRVMQIVEGENPPPGVTLECRSISEPILVRGDAQQIDRILINLIRNAVQAMDESGTIQIVLSLRTESQIAIVDVDDDGVGVTEEHRARIFEPLFTSKAKGIGLGLAVSRRYAEQNGGKLVLVERSGPGATFRLTLPLAAD
ncbi:MAG: PAS domain S-box protein [Planctomycetaceae bacterium]|nr:PAS domain S-box protein [Planctomycetaceae bacterium]